MATFKTNTKNTYYAILTCTELTPSGNTSKVKYSLKLYSGNNNFSGYTIGYRIKINGTQVAYHNNSGNQTSMSANSSKTVVSGTTSAITHTANGTKSVSVSVEVWTDNVYYLPVSLKASGTMTLTDTAFSITYNTNDGTGGSSTDTKYYGTTYTIKAGPSRTGYTFQGWGTSSSATSATYKAGASYTTNANLTLYAIWKINTYSITYNANGGTGAPASQTKTYGTNIKLQTGTPTRADSINESGATVTHTFIGWGTSASATSVAYNPGDSYTGNADLNLYAIWKSISGYLIKFNTNADGDNVKNMPGADEKSNGINYTIPNKTPERDGYNFKGWSTTSTGSINYQPGSIYSTNANLTLYAIWEPWSFTLSFNLNGGNGTLPPDINLTIETPYLFLEETLQKENYIFVGWSKDPDGFSKIYKPGDLFFEAQDGGTIILYAVWSLNDVLIYSNSYCKGNEFIEIKEVSDLSFTKEGKIQTYQFIEGTNFNFNKNGLSVNEIIEKHSLYKLLDSSENRLIDEKGNRLFFIYNI